MSDIPAPDAPTNDDWLANPAPPPRSLVELTQQGGLADLAAELLAAPVVAEPAPAAAAPTAGAKPAAPAPHPTAGAKEPGADKPAKAAKVTTFPGQGGAARGRPKGDIWDGCPVQALGVNGEVSYYLDRHGQLRAVDNHTAQKILHVFGDKLGALCLHFPTFSKDGSRREGKFDQTAASMAMITAASEKGLFNPDGAVRGVGAWRNDAGELIYHCGDKLICAEGTLEPCEIDGKIYPAYPPIPAPALAVGRADPAAEALAVLESWNWMRPDVQPMLALGMVGVQMLGGALDWRPLYWLTGDKASGKSTFQEWLKLLHGDKGLIQSNDPTKSGITSRLGHSALPVAIDELEPGDEGSNKERDIITLARVAASGGQWLRGSADQKGASGNVYSAFLFSSILIPGAMGPQDRSRTITLDLGPLPETAPKLALEPRAWRARGAALKRLLIDRWPTWAERLAIWRVALAEAGLGGRNGDNYATTLAMADMAVSAELPAQDVVRAWAEKAARAARTETEEIGSDAEEMLAHLIGQPFDVFRRGEMFNVAHWLMVAACLPGAPRQLLDAGSDKDGATWFMDEEERRGAAKRANEKLAKAGLRVSGEGEAAELFIANKPIPGLAHLFERSRWANGVWAQSSRRVLGAKPVAQPLTLAGQRCRGVYIPLRHVAGMLAFPMDRTPTQLDPQEAPPYSSEDFA